MPLQPLHADPVLEGRPGTLPDWRAELANAITDPAELCQLLNLPGNIASNAASRDFSLLVPRPYLRRIQPGDPNDPLLLQILPRKEELQERAGFSKDPLREAGSAGEGEPGACPQAMTLWKYHSRLLIVTTAGCAVHCRFCFRRHFPYRTAAVSETHWEKEFAAIAAEPSLQEVILSGGDPLTLDDDSLAHIIHQLTKAPHLCRIRIHSRLPIMIPQRVTAKLTEVLRATRLATFLVVHVNHAAEVDDEVAKALGRIVDAGVPVMSQTVLLRGVNDRLADLVALFERLVNLRVLPYYLHQLDRVAGAAHFEVPEVEGTELMRQLRDRLPGYAVPRYVRETPGATHKHPLG